MRVENGATCGDGLMKLSGEYRLYRFVVGNGVFGGVILVILLDCTVLLFLLGW